jgi:hypothetical protein
MDSMLRWAVRIRDWHPSTEEWQFLLQLIPTVEQRQVRSLPEERRPTLHTQMGMPHPAVPPSYSIIHKCGIRGLTAHFSMVLTR